MGLTDSDDFETQARELLIKFGDNYEYAAYFMHDNDRSPASQIMEARLELLNEILSSLLALHQAELQRTKDDMLHRVGDTLSWYIAQGRIELRHLHLEHIMNILGQTFPASLGRPESSDE